VCPGMSNMQMKMSFEHWWNGTDRGQPKYSGKVCPITTFIDHNKLHMAKPGFEPVPHLEDSFQSILYLNIQFLPSRERVFPLQILVLFNI
jgi:hypothetical protein